MELNQSVQINHIEDTQSTKGKVIKKSGKRIGYNYIILRSYKESQKNDVVKCLYIKSLTKFGFCVIKEGSLGDSKDAHERDIKDRLQWQKTLHEMLQNKVRIPRYYGNFEENGNYYLVIERIKGKPLYKIIRENSRQTRLALLTKNRLGISLLKYMLQITNLLEKLHQQEVVHRDVTPNNFLITPGKKAALIDMELSYALTLDFPNPPFQLGTFGYMSPEQIRTDTPTKEQDIYSLGAIFLFMWSGISPMKIINENEENLKKRIGLFIPEPNFSSIIQKCLSINPKERPSLQEVKKVVLDYTKGKNSSVNVVSATEIPLKRHDIPECITHFLDTLRSSMLYDENKGWFSEDLKNPGKIDKSKINKAYYASLFNGAAGIVYLLSKIKACNLPVTGYESHIDNCLTLIQRKYINRMETTSPSLLTGSAGIAVAIAEGMKSGLIGTDPLFIKWINQLLNVDNSRLNFSSGISGQGIAHFLCYPYISEETLSQKLLSYVKILRENQHRNGTWSRKNDEEKRVTKGFFNGMAGILYFLLDYTKHYQEESVLKMAEKGMKWLINCAITGKGSVNWKSSQRKSIAPWIKEGVPGIALSFIKAYSITNKPIYREYAYAALHYHPYEVLDNDLSQANGLSGLGEAYLQAWQVFKDPEWLKRADWIVNVIMNTVQNNSKNEPYWFVESEKTPVADFMIGNTGIIHFLLRYCFPHQIPFPLT